MMLSFLQASLGAAGLYLLYAIYWELTIGASHRKIAAANGCKQPAVARDWDPVLNFQHFLETLRNQKERTLLNLSQARFARYGNTYSLKLLGTPVIMTSEPDNIKTMLALDFKKWSLGIRRKKSFVPFLGHGIFTTDGAAWQHSREMLRPNFTRVQVGNLDTFETHVTHLISRIPRDGSAFDIQELFFALTIDSSTEFLFGESTSSLLAPVPSSPAAVAATPAQRFATAFGAGQEACGRRARYGILWSIVNYLNKEHAEHIHTVHAFVDQFVDKAFARKASGKIDTSRYIFADELVSQTSDREQVRSELLNILLAGRDTTASLLSNVFHVLARRPDVFALLRAEVLASLPAGQRPTFESIKDMRYLRAVLNESLRVHPVVPGNSRQAEADTTLPLGGGPDGRSPVFIPSGTLVLYSVYAMHHRKDLFGADADEFRPERWLDDEKTGRKGLRPGWEYLPFNGGPRICLGQQFALTEASYTIIRLLQEFGSLESRDDQPWREWLTLTCTNFGGTWISMSPA